jgi:hypothetical protein
MFTIQLLKSGKSTEFFKAFFTILLSLFVKQQSSRFRLDNNCVATYLLPGRAIPSFNPNAINVTGQK